MENGFNSLLNPKHKSNVDIHCIENDGNDNSHFNGELLRAVYNLKNNKACGIDEIPNEVLKSGRLCNVLLSMFNECYMEGVIPSIWKQGIINPIPKASTTDRRDPLNYRGITVTPACYKLFCRILNARLDKWEAENRILSDNQNGFRKGRNTIDHISSLTTLIETRKVKKKSTYAAFIDFRKAYDSVNRNILSEKLKNKGIHGKMYNALKVIYDNVGCTVRINGKLTDWFNVGCGLKQGCSLSSILFNLYI